MMPQERVVTVKQLPETFVKSRRSAFFCEIKSYLDIDRPCLVLDCSQLTRMDKQIVLFLLCCLEEAMKRNGDVRLSGLSSVAKATLKAVGADILFKLFESNADAIASFSRRPVDFSLRVSMQESTESAA